MNAQMSAEEVLAVIAKHRDSHMSCALADAYSAHPRIHASTHPAPAPGAGNG